VNALKSGAGTVYLLSGVRVGLCFRGFANKISGARLDHSSASSHSLFPLTLRGRSECASPVDDDKSTPETFRNVHSIAELPVPARNDETRPVAFSVPEAVVDRRAEQAVVADGVIT
jgi:hypothetical protein